MVETLESRPFLRAGDQAYSSSCEVVHVDEKSYQHYQQTTDENRIMSSFFTSLEGEIRPKGLGIKYVAQGQENYLLQDKRYHVSEGRYFLVNESAPSLDVAIPGVPTWSVCVDVDVKLVNEVLLQWLQPNEPDNYHQVSRYLLTPELFVREAEAGQQLQALLASLISAGTSQGLARPPIEWIFELITLLVQDNRALIGSYYRLRASRLSTRKELFRRLLLGKEMLDDSLFSGTTIKQVAESCCLSEFRFYRLFKQCFGDSPYQYLTRRRIASSLELKKQGLSWSEIAYALNFTDLAAFSNSFKKLKGVAPTKVA
ncbi:AraC-like DNA-binding protein [Pontibacter ummariensis]|uniref:AraC-type DNA-binding protein n=1 Tax=Pontibacter ummariensis TaxID=1610492 RepID=A0A239DBM8_9BACT|nr:AraC family transcriptional regulator [Pontibacter ummariensis]PRY14344.1 AraC-like DNA-binding protein [Pontibacter ummariensis]SNS29720.1 AraC-type DNA-binding protein [Pontibacter ummariensis]